MKEYANRQPGRSSGYRKISATEIEDNGVRYRLTGRIDPRTGLRSYERVDRLQSSGWKTDLRRKRLELMALE